MENPPISLEILRDFEPIPGVAPGTEPIAAVDEIPELFPEEQTLYAVIDAARAPLLADRLERSGLAYRSLYRGHEYRQMGDVAPYLVALKPEDSGLTTDLFRSDPDGNDPAALLDRSCALLLQSTHPIEVVEDRLRRMTMLPDETGVRMFFRLAAPGAVPAACFAAPQEEVAWVFDKFTALCWTRPSLEDGKWQLLGARPDPHLAEVSQRPLVLTPAVRRTLALAVAEEKARDMARAHADTLEERTARAQSYTRMMAVRFDNEGWLRTTHDLISNLPDPQAQTSAWAFIETGAHSLAQMHARVAAAFGREVIFP